MIDEWTMNENTESIAKNGKTADRKSFIRDACTDDISNPGQKNEPYGQALRTNFPEKGRREEISLNDFPRKCFSKKTSEKLSAVKYTTETSSRRQNRLKQKRSGLPMSTAANRHAR